MMKKITLSVNDTKFPFFMELINSLDFVKVEPEDGDSKEDIVKNLTSGIKELKSSQAVKTTKRDSLKEFLNEL
jgi:hypothetical protein